MRLRTLISTGTLALLAAACTGIVTEPGASNSSGPGSKGNPPSKTSSALCTSDEPSVAATPLRRLTVAEYRFALSDLFGESAAIDVDLVSDETVAGYATNSIAAITKNMAGEYAAAAEKIAPLALPRVQQDSGCASQKSCLSSYLPVLARRVFRRPLPKADLARYEAMFDTASTKWGVDEAMTLVLEAMIASPNFIYVTEAAAPHSAKLEKLDGFAVAARMSFFLWQSNPDDALLDAAEAGELDEPAGIAKQAERILKDDRAKRGVDAFISQWLEVGEVREQSKDPDLYPNWSTAVAGQAYDETLNLAQSVILQGDAQFETLMTTRATSASGELAALYGISKGEDVPAQRAGLLGRSAFLAAHAHPTDGSVVHRGKFVRERVLCQDLPLPPSGIDMSDPNRLSNPSCKGCHEGMDPIGKGFDQFDAVGQYSAKGFTPDFSGGEVLASPEESDVDGQFSDARDLAHKLAQSVDARRCVPVQWARYAFRRDDEADACGIAKLADRFVSENMDLRALMVELVQSDGFRFRPTEG